jgi:trk system potassium uptake protein TrkA
MELVGLPVAPVKRVVLTGNNLSTRELAAAIQGTIPSVTLIDPELSDAEKVASELNNVDVLHGDCTVADTLSEADISRADFFVASSNEADYNMLSALLAKTQGARETIAVSTDFQHDMLFHSIGIDHVINPRITAAREIMQIISRGYIGSMVRLAEAEIEAVRYTVPESAEAVGMPLKKVWKKLRSGALIGIIIRDDRMQIPDGDSVIQPEDHVIIVAYTRSLPAVRRLFKKRS